MHEVNPPRFAWLKVYAVAIPVFVMLVAAIPVTRNAVLHQMYPDRAVASTVRDDLERINSVFAELDGFDDSQLADVQ